MSKYLENDAVISDCGLYRYLLRRTWDHSKPRALFVMLNPSTADARVDDPTIRSCVRLLGALSYGSMEVVNLFALRATDPTELQRSDDPIGARNNLTIEAAIGRCDLTICAWGAHPMAGNRSSEVWGLLRGRRPAVFCFGTTKSGAPKHPLYIKSETPLTSYTGASPMTHTARDGWKDILERVAAIKLWRDVYPDGPDIFVSGTLSTTFEPQNVRDARAMLSAAPSPPSEVTREEIAAYDAALSNIIDLGQEWTDRPARTETHDGTIAAYARRERDRLRPLFHQRGEKG